jgi:hypothetical protein
MYQITEKEQEHGGKWRVRVIASPSEAVFLWFDVEPTQEAVDQAVDRQLQQQALSNPAVVVTDVLTCDAWQIRRALNQLGWRDAVEYAVENSENRDIQDGWFHATRFARYDPFVLMMVAVLGKTEAEADALFALAKSF